ncbi:MAG: hypothetical protein FRX49_00766 [Trebouxia sp. A1-2]|nr:MAG: hypothetical protein FRX49_00766 [Trebouxia sp. A1-2]
MDWAELRGDPCRHRSTPNQSDFSLAGTCAGEGLPMLMLHVTKAPPDLPAATNNSDCPASSLMAVRTRYVIKEGTGLLAGLQADLIGSTIIWSLKALGSLPVLGLQEALPDELLASRRQPGLCEPQPVHLITKP